MKTKYVLDASALLVLIQEEKGQEKVLEYLPESCMSTINVSEVASVLQLIKMPNKEIEVLLRNLIPETVNFDIEDAFITAQLRTSTKEKGLSLGDRACLAVGKQKNLTVITADRAWTNIDTRINVVVIR